MPTNTPRSIQLVGSAELLQRGSVDWKAAASAPAAQNRTPLPMRPRWTLSIFR